MAQRYQVAVSAMLLTLLAVSPCSVAQSPCPIMVYPGESIQAAIDAAPEGAVICLDAGEWEEHVTIGHSVILRGSESGSTIRGYERYVPVITIRPGGEREVLVELDRVTVTGAREAEGIKILGSAEAKILHSTIIGNATDGIFTYGKAKIWIEESTIVENGRSGVSIDDASQAHILDSLIAENADGIVVRGAAQATISNNTVRGNSVVGIAVWSTREAVGTGNAMQDNGVDLSGNVAGGLRLSWVEATESAISYPDSRYPTLQHAVDALLPGGRLALEQGEHIAGLTISKRIQIVGPATLRGPDGSAAVLSLVNGAQLFLLGVTLTGDGAGLRAGGNSQATLLNCTIDGTAVGIDMDHSARVELMNCLIRRAMAGIGMWGFSQIAITNTTVADSGGSGVILWESAQAAIINSVIAGNAGAGIVSTGSSALRMLNSVVRGNQEAGVALVGSSGTAVAGSLIQGNGGPGIVLWEGAAIRLDRTHVKQNGTFGIALIECVPTRPPDIPSCVWWMTIRFTGYVAGSGNVIPGPDETDGNIAGSVCPGDLAFLLTQEGGELDWTDEPLEFCLYLFAPEYAGCGRVTISGVFRSDAEGPPSWDWGDGTVTQGWFPQSHRYSSAGVYTVIVTVGQLTQSVTVVIEDTAGPGCAIEPPDEG